jgi:hypothetical protein
MRLGGGRNERIHDRQFLARPFSLSLDLPPAERRIQIDVDDPPGKPLDEVKSDPCLQLIPFRTIRDDSGR